MSSKPTDSTPDVLPNTLNAGDVLETKTGHRVEIIVTSGVDAYDQRLYRLRHIGGIAHGTVSNLTASRDQLQADGLKLVERKA